MSLKQELQQRFAKVFTNGEELYAISHYSFNGVLVASVYYKTESGQRRIETVDTHDDKVVSDYLDEGGNVETLNQQLPTAMFSGTCQEENQCNFFEYTNKAWCV